MTPQHTHDCPRCTLIGQMPGVDIYKCQGGGSILMREGPDGPDYRSWGDEQTLKAVAVHTKDPVYVAACAMLVHARQKGVIQ